VADLIAFPDRKECPGGRCLGCGCTTSTITTKNGQDVVRCSNCDSYIYCAPKAETGRATRSVSTVPDIKPKQRDRIISRAQIRCERCGKHAMASKTGLHVGHVLSKDEGVKQGLTADIINSDENLICECDECNLGHGRGVLPVRLLVAILTARVKK
jgi:hypothetical protein